MSKRCRPVVLNAQKRNEILAILSSGCGRQTAARIVNCDPKIIDHTAKLNPGFAARLARAEILASIRGNPTCRIVCSLAYFFTRNNSTLSR
jgi:hypothetical protein